MFNPKEPFRLLSAERATGDRTTIRMIDANKTQWEVVIGVPYESIKDKIGKIISSYDIEDEAKKSARIKANAYLDECKDQIKEKWIKTAAMSHIRHLYPILTPEEVNDIFDKWFHLNNENCCCHCQYQLLDCSHPHTDGKSCTEKRGFACAPPGANCIYSGWSEHGECEMFDERAKSVWIKPKTPTIVPHSELAMHVGAAGRFVRGFARTGEDYAHILYGDEGNPKPTHGLMSEVLPFGSEAYKTCKASAIISSDSLYNAPL